MRITTTQIFNIANNSIADANQAIVKTQQEISTGRKFLTPADDPVAATKVLAVNEELGSIEQFKKNLEVAKSNLTLEETTLDGVNNIILRIQELAVQAGNTATLSEVEYDALASEVDERIDELKNILNSKNISDAYIFGGYKSTEAPFVGSVNTGFSYLGDDGQQFIQVSNSTTIAASDSGKSIFVDIQSANNTFNTQASSVNRANPAASISVGQVFDQDAYDQFYPEDIVITFNEDSSIVPAGKNFTAIERSTGRAIVENQRFRSGEHIDLNGTRFSINGDPASAEPGKNGDQFFIDSSEKQDILTTVSRFSEAIKDFDGSQESRDAIESMVASTIDNLANVQTSVLETMTKIGSRINTLDSTEQFHLDSGVALRELLSDLQDVDLAEAATRLSGQTLILEAAQASFVRISRLTLFSQL